MPPGHSDPPAISHISRTQSRELRKLETELDRSLLANDFELARGVISRITAILRPLQQETRLLKYKNWYFQALMDHGDTDRAIQGFLGIRRRTSKQTRVRLEATTLLAIAFLRSNQVERAKPLIIEVMSLNHVIKSPSRRQEFRKLVYDRFDEEIVLAACKGIGRDNLYTDHGVDADIGAMWTISEATAREYVYIAISAIAGCVAFNSGVFVV